MIDQYFGGKLDTEMKCVESDEEPVATGEESFLQLSCFISQDVKYLQSGLRSVGLFLLHYLDWQKDTAHKLKLYIIVRAHWATYIPTTYNPYIFYKIDCFGNTFVVRNAIYASHAKQWQSALSILAWDMWKAFQWVDLTFKVIWNLAFIAFVVKMGDKQQIDLVRLYEVIYYVESRGGRCLLRQCCQFKVKLGI